MPPQWTTSNNNLRLKPNAWLDWNAMVISCATAPAVVIGTSTRLRSRLRRRIVPVLAARVASIHTVLVIRVSDYGYKGRNPNEHSHEPC